MKVKFVEESKRQNEERFDHLVKIKLKLEQSEESAMTVQLDLFQDPLRFFTARLLDPHGLDYAWPFGGLAFSFDALNEGNNDEVKPEYIFLEGISIVGAFWNKEKLCLSEEKGNTSIWKIRGIPADIRYLKVPESCIEIPLFSNENSEEIVKVPLNIGDQSADYWKRKNVFLKIG